MSQVLWDSPAGSETNLITTGLDSLANGSASAYGTEFNNLGGATLGQLHLHLASNSLTFTANSVCTIFLVPSLTPWTASGSYPTYTSGASYKLAQGNYSPIPIFINPAAISAAVVDEVTQWVPIPSGYFKAILLNNSGNNFPASSNTLGLVTTGVKIV